eukprot:scaffold44632_cov19-Tisochrysis_lutea.AAC.1
MLCKCSSPVPNKPGYRVVGLLAIPCNPCPSQKKYLLEGWAEILTDSFWLCFCASQKTLGVGADGTAQQPADQQQQGAGMEQGGHQVPVQHYLFGDPFVLKVGAAETLGSLKQRIK